MTDIDPLPPVPHHRRHWIEYVATGVALLLSGVSLWVAIGTMDANNKMVAAASWPFLQITTSDADAQGNSVLSFKITNAGVGPALVESFEASLDGKPVRTSREILARCCGYDPSKPGPVAVNQPSIGSWTEGTVGNTVIRAGEDRIFFTWAKSDANAKAWTVLRNLVAKGHLVARACYCSVFNECWQGAFIGIHPVRVDRCLAPALSYTQ